MESGGPERPQGPCGSVLMQPCCETEEGFLQEVAFEKGLERSRKVFSRGETQEMQRPKAAPRQDSGGVILAEKQGRSPVAEQPFFFGKKKVKEDSLGLKAQLGGAAALLWSQRGAHRRGCVEERLQQNRALGIWKVNSPPEIRGRHSQTGPDSPSSPRAYFAGADERPERLSGRDHTPKGGARSGSHSSILQARNTC